MFCSLDHTETLLELQRLKIYELLCYKRSPVCFVMTVTESHMTDTLPIQQTYPLFSVLNFTTSTLSFILVLDPVNHRNYSESNQMIS